MEPQYRFCTSADGTRIAFSIVGDHPGTPFVHIIGWAVALEWLYERPPFRSYDNGPAQGRRAGGPGLCRPASGTRPPATAVGAICLRCRAREPRDDARLDRADPRQLEP